MSFLSDLETFEKNSPYKKGCEKKGDGRKFTLTDDSHIIP